MEDILNKIYEYMATYGLKVIAAVAIFLIGRLIAKLLVKVLAKGMTTAKVDRTLASFIEDLAYIVMLVFVIMAALAKLEVQTTSLIAVVGAAGLAIGLALQGSLANFASGVLMLIFKPFKVDDFVQIAGATGTVKEIQIFNTIITTPDNLRVIVPNGHVTGGNIINYTINGTRRVDLVIGVSYGDDLKKTKQIIEDVLSGHDKVLKDPAPTVAVSELADSSVNFVVRPWCNSADYWDVYFDITIKVKIALDENGISIPFPQRDVHMITGS